MKKLVFGLIAIVMFSFNSQAQQLSKVFPIGGITTHSHLMSISGDCYSVWVGVFWTDGGEETLIASGVSQIGNCSKLSSNNNPRCEDKIHKGDYIYNSNYENLKYCLTDCLLDDNVDKSYQIEKEKILNSINK